MLLIVCILIVYLQCCKRFLIWFEIICTSPHTSLVWFAFAFALRTVLAWRQLPTSKLGQPIRALSVAEMSSAALFPNHHHLLPHTYNFILLFPLPPNTMPPTRSSSNKSMSQAKLSFSNVRKASSFNSASGSGKKPKAQPQPPVKADIVEEISSDSSDAAQKELNPKDRRWTKLHTASIKKMDGKPGKCTSLCGTTYAHILTCYS